MRRIISVLVSAIMFLSLYTTTVCADSFNLERDKILTAHDLPTYTTVDFSGRTEVMKFENTSMIGTKAIRYGGLNLTTAYSSANKTLLVDCFLDDLSVSSFSLSVVFRKTTNEKWITNAAPEISTRNSGEFEANKWVTVAIDCEDSLSYLVNNNDTLDQLQINIPSTTGNFYVDNVRFTDDEIIKDTSFIVESSKILADSGYTPYTKDVNFDGKAGLLKFENTDSDSRIRYGKINMSPEHSSKSRYLIVDCYLDDYTESEFDLTAVFRKTTDEKWITNTAPEISTRKSDKYETNKWVSVIIDCGAPLKYLAENNYTLDQMQINLPTSSGSLYIGKVRFADYVGDVALYDESNKKCDWKNGNLKAKISFTNEFEFSFDSVTVYAVVYNDQAENIVADGIYSKTLDIKSGDKVELPISVSDKDNSFMKIMLLDENNKAICSTINFGIASAVVALQDAESVSELTIDKPIVDENRNVTITGSENVNTDSRYIVLVCNDSRVLFVDEQKVQRPDGENKKFVFKFDSNLSNVSDFENYSGMYDVYVYSYYSDTLKKTILGIPYDRFFDDYITLINEMTDTSEISIDDDKKIQNCYTKYMLPKNFLGSNFYVEEIFNDASKNIYRNVLDVLIKGKPETGYTKEGFEALFNGAVIKATFENADNDKKFKLIASEYCEFLKTSEIAQSSAYKLLSQTDAKRDAVFYGVSFTANDFTDRLNENIVVCALNICQNAMQIKDIVEENTTKLNISLSDKYSKLNDLQKLALYEKMLPKSQNEYSNYASVASKFKLALDEASSSTSQGSSGSGGSGDSGKNNTVPISASSNGVFLGHETNAQTSRFKDIEDLTWGKAEIEDLTDRGIVDGMSEDEFWPDSSITREQFCKLISKAFDITGSGSISFTDVNLDSWYAPYVLALYSNNYIEGETDSYFGTGKNITREDAAVILYRVVEEKIRNTGVGIDFVDSVAISDYAKSAVSAMASAGILDGYDDKTFRPKNNITRREAAVILCRVLNFGR